MSTEAQQPESLFDKILAKINDLTTLEIKTIVGDHSIHKSGDVVIDTSKNADVIFSQFNLLDGDITSGFNPKFLQEPYSAVRDYHAEREKDAKDIIKKNIETLEALLQLIVRADSYKGKGPDAAGTGTTPPASGTGTGA